MKHPRSRDRTVLVQHKYQAHSAPDKAQLQYAFLIYGAMQLRQHGIGAVLRVAGNADRIPAEAFDPVMAALGLHVDQGTTHQALAIDKFSRCHSKLLHRIGCHQAPLVATFLQMGSEQLRNGQKRLARSYNWRGPIMFRILSAVLRRSIVVERTKLLAGAWRIECVELSRTG